MGARTAFLGFLGRLVRGRRLDHNPLRRATDRVETAVLAVLVAAFLAGTPFAALAAGTSVHGLAERAQLSQQASRFQVPAVVLAVAASTPGGDFPDQAQARWRAPNGREAAGEVPVPSGTVAGQTIRLWTDRAGDLTGAPLTDAQVAEQTFLGEGLGVALAAGVLTLVGALAYRALNRRRMAGWDADWRVTGPRWTTRA